MPRAKWALHVDIYEPEGAGMGYPVVRHSFFGKTKKEAEGYCTAHLGTDVFMRDCMDTGKWQRIVCPAFVIWQGLDG